MSFLAQVVLPQPGWPNDGHRLLTQLPLLRQVLDLVFVVGIDDLERLVDALLHVTLEELLLGVVVQLLAAAVAIAVATAFAFARVDQRLVDVLVVILLQVPGHRKHRLDLSGVDGLELHVFLEVDGWLLSKVLGAAPQSCGHVLVPLRHHALDVLVDQVLEVLEGDVEGEPLAVELIVHPPGRVCGNQLLTGGLEVSREGILFVVDVARA